MANYRITHLQTVPADIDTLWEFFTSHNNLKKITPEYMGFDITSEHPEGEKVYAGMIITYKLKPLLGIPLNWMTEITHVREKEYFVDEQRFGPYALWHHQHLFRQVDGGVEMKDIVDYKLPLGLLGDIAHSLFVRKQIEGIFNFRNKKVEELFGVIK
jgi:ligand-binding SRPBCC domain-containing protein